MSRKPKPEIKTVNLFEFLTERIVRKLEEQLIYLEVQFADGVRTFEITEKNPWYKELNRRRQEQIEAFRARSRLYSRGKTSPKVMIAEPNQNAPESAYKKFQKEN